MMYSTTCDMNYLQFGVSVCEIITKTLISILYEDIFENEKG